MMINNIPSDPIILLSFINTKLRDEYPSLQELCASLDIDRNTVEAKLGTLGYFYNKELNKFV